MPHPFSNDLRERVVAFVRLETLAMRLPGILTLQFLLP